MNNKFTTLTIAISLLVLLIGCENNFVDSDNNGIVDPVPVVIKKKHMENSVTKDIAFGTGNWHKVNRYIVDTEGNLYKNRISERDWVLCEVGDTLWTMKKFNDFYPLYLK